METFAKVKTYRFSDGQNRPILLGAKEGGLHLPFFYPNLYISFDQKTASEGTIYQILNALKSVYAWGVRENIDFQKRLLTLVFFDEHELYNLVDALHLDYRDLKEQAKTQLQKLAADSKTSNLVRLHKSTTVSGATFNSRMGCVSAYFHWLANRTINMLQYSQRDEPENRNDNMKRWFSDRHVSPEALTFVALPSAEAMDFLWSVIQPDSPYNVWAPEARFRNYLIFRIYLDTGIRRSELLTIYVADFRQAENKIYLTKRPNDPIDPRTPKPSVKTFGRSLNLTSKVSQLLQDYIIRDRIKHRAARKHPFLITSLSDGAPLSSDAIYDIFKALHRFPLLEGLTPHILRHTFTDELMRLAMSKGLDRELVADFQRGAMGWSADSSMPAHYLQQLRDEIVTELAIRRQERFERDQK